MNRIRERYLILLFARAVEHTRNALIGLALDYLAYRIGRLWVVGAATLVVRNGRAVFLFSWAVERLCLYLLAVVGGVDQLDSCFVFSIALFVVHVAHPLVFTNEVNLPLAEVWHDFRQTGVPTLPVFVYMVGMVHYPRWTARTTLNMVFKRVPQWLWWHCTLEGAWNVSLCVCCALVLYQTVLVPLVMFLRVVAELAWRWVGREYYRLCVWALHLLTRGKPPGGFHRQRRLGHNKILRPFAYTSLGDDQMRVLHLLPRGNSATVRCELEHVSLDKRLIYEAMSYTWGPQHPEEVWFCKTVYINNHPLRVTQRVYDLLLNRSPAFSPRTIWIDAICINQKDDLEKGRQVALMHQIFSRASRVTVSLGEAPNAHLAIDLLFELSHLFKNYDMTDAELWERYTPERRSARWLALGDMMEHPYFTRIWIVQEVAANENVHVVYGGQLINWDTLMRVLPPLLMANRLSMLVEDTAVVGTKRIALINGFHIITMDKVREATQNDDPPNLADMLVPCWTLQGSDRRDKIFALWALASDGDNDLVRPDYTKTDAQVFTDAAVYMGLRGTGQDMLRVLGCAGIGWLRDVPDIPSWAPDWSTVGRSMIGAFPQQSTNQYRPYGDLETSALRVIAGDSMMLELDAIIVVEPIKHMTREFQRPMAQTKHGYLTDINQMARLTEIWVAEALCLVGDHLGHDVAKVIYPPTGQTLEEAFWRTLIVDFATYSGDASMAPTKQNRPAPAAYGAYYRDYLAYHISNPDAAEVMASPTLLAVLSSLMVRRHRDAEYFDPQDDMDRPRKSGLWATAVQSHCLSRKLAITGENGLLALVPPGSEAGDTIAIVPGVMTPLIVRPVGQCTVDNDEVAKLAVSLVGECYVHGLMDGGEWVKQEAVKRIVMI
ncbi:hypothetical protein N657DRAFT_494594 [Parathielavia appendiculata]|uniref:Heterokaryon incompatibility domain-containing protein n=1 Tax=Parathielavia appendiculata TaxID=2587402 RepID=A0AAN6Z1K8_9PEZI|nr:hypothetical protein N657DRAFT_494594 [Parathielavia appendiculata]